MNKNTTSKGGSIGSVLNYQGGDLSSSVSSPRTPLSSFQVVVLGESSKGIL